ncbi:MAG: type IV pilin [Halococcoides sp.]
MPSTRAVSPVVGTVVMIAITVVLVATIATVVLAFDDELQDPTPPSAFDYEYAADGEGNSDNRPYVKLYHVAGRPVDADRVVIKDESGNRVYWNEVWTGGETLIAGDYVHIDGYMSDGALDPICEAGDTYGKFEAKASPFRAVSYP